MMVGGEEAEDFTRAGSREESYCVVSEEDMLVGGVDMDDVANQGINHESLENMIKAVGKAKAAEHENVVQEPEDVVAALNRTDRAMSISTSISRGKTMSSSSSNLRTKPWLNWKSASSMDNHFVGSDSIHHSFHVIKRSSFL